MTSRRLLGVGVLLPTCAATAGEIRVDWNHQFLTHTRVRVWAEVTVEAPPAQFAGVAGTLFNMVGTDTGASRLIDFDENAGLGRLLRGGGPNQLGALSGASIMGVDAFQSPPAFNPQFVQGTVLPEFFVFEYQFTDMTPRVVSFTSTHDYFHVFAGPMGAMGQNQAASVDVFGTQIDFPGAVIPLPGAAGLAFVGLTVMGTGRRRS